MEHNYDKRASQGTLSQMTNPFRTKNYGYANDISANNTMMSNFNDLNRTNGQNDYAQRSDYNQQEE